MQYVIIGAGPAGVVAAETLRKTDPKGEVMLVRGEAELPYARMTIPYYLAGKISEAGTHIRHRDDHFDSLGIRTVTGRVTGVSPEERRVVLEGGESLSFDRLLVATGSTPSPPPIPGLDLPGVVPCWTLADAREIVRRVESGGRVVILGAGFVACIILQGLASRGVDLTLVMGSSGRMVRSMMNPIAGGLIRRWCEAEGVRIVGGHRVREIGAGPRVVLNNGQTLPADLVVVATGVTPNTDLLDGSGVVVEDGILADDHLATTVPDIYAAGDVAQGPDFSTRGRSVHAIQPAAVEHGRTAALNMSGRDVTFQGSLGMNVLETLGLVSTSMGSWQGVEGGEAAEVLDEGGFRYLHLEFEGDRLVGVNCVGATDHIGMLRGLIQTRVPLGEWKARLMADPSRFREALVARSHIR